MENESKYPVLRYHVDAKLDGDALIYQPGVCDDMAKTFLAFQEASEAYALASWGFRREDVVRVLDEADRLRAENAELREQLAADGWIDPDVELPPDDDMVLAIVSGKPADNITLEDAYELASYSAEDGWIVEGYELWEAPSVSWWRPLPDPPEKKKEER